MGLIIPTECSLPASECGWRWSGWGTSWSGQRDCPTPTTSQSWSSQVPRPTCWWKWVGGTKYLKSGISTLTANISAKYHCFHQSGAFLELPMHKFSELVEKLKKDSLTWLQEHLEYLPPVWGGSSSSLGRICLVLQHMDFFGWPCHIYFTSVSGAS